MSGSSRTTLATPAFVDISAAIAGGVVIGVEAVALASFWTPRIMIEPFYTPFQVTFAISFAVFLIVLLRNTRTSRVLTWLALGAGAGYLTGLVAYFTSLFMVGDGVERMQNMLDSRAGGVFGLLSAAAWGSAAMLCWFFGGIAAVVSVLARRLFLRRHETTAP